MIEEKKSHSGLGIASFVLSIIFVLGILVTFGWAGYLELTTPGGIDEEAPLTAFLGLGMMFFIGIGLIGFILGIISLFMKDQKKVFGILGTVLCGIFFIFAIGTFVLGVITENAEENAGYSVETIE